MSAQFLLFLRSILLGMALGLLYDLIRAVRHRGGGAVWQGILDGLYALASAGALFFFVMAGDGELRLFILLGCIGGAVLHFCVLSGPMAPLFDFWLGIFLLPLEILMKFAKKVGIFCKKLFSFWKRWFTIISTKLHRYNCPSEEGDQDMATNSKSKRGSAASKEAKPARRPSSKLTMLLLLVLALGIVVQLRNMQVKLDSAKAEEAAYTARLEDLKETNARLAMEIQHSSDRDLLEDIARDDLGMAAPGEKIFRFN